MISGFDEPAVNSFGRNWTIQMLINLVVTLEAVVRCFLPKMLFKAPRSLSVSLEVAGITPVAVSSVLLEFRNGP